MDMEDAIETFEDLYKDLKSKDKPIDMDDLIEECVDEFNMSKEDVVRFEKFINDNFDE